MSDQQQSIFDLAIVEDEEALFKALNEGGDANSKNSEGKTAFIAAFEAGLFKNVEILVEHGAEFENELVCVGGFKQSVLHHAAAFGLVKTIEKLIEKGADLNVANQFFLTPLSLACATGICTPKTIEYLIEKGANVNVNSTDGDSLVLNMAKRRKSEIAAILAKHGADVDARDKDGNNAFEVALDGDDKILLKAILEVFPERKETLEKIFTARINMFVDFMKKMSTATEDDERWTVVPEVAASIEATKEMMLDVLGIEFQIPTNE